MNFSFLILYYLFLIYYYFLIYNYIFFLDFQIKLFELIEKLMNYSNPPVLFLIIVHQIKITSYHFHQLWWFSLNHHHLNDLNLFNLNYWSIEFYQVHIIFVFFVFLFIIDLLKIENGQNFITYWCVFNFWFLLKIKNY